MIVKRKFGHKRMNVNMVIGKPVVANEEIPDHKEAIEQSRRRKEESFADGIVELLNKPEKMKKMRRKGRQWVVINRSYESMAREMEKKYFEILQSIR